MKLGHGNEISYTATVGTLVIFTLALEGEPTMLVTCDTADAARTIQVGSVAHPGLVVNTKGRFETTTKLLEAADGSPLGTETRVDRKSVYTYVLPRVALLLGRLLRLPCPDCELNH